MENTAQAGEDAQEESNQQNAYNDIDLEKLGRQRPAEFVNGWVEIGFCVSLLGSIFLAVCIPSDIRDHISNRNRNTSLVVSILSCRF